MTDEPQDTTQETVSNTVSNSRTRGLKPFVKGYDPRRNTRGVPKETLAARKRLREVMAELLDMPDGQGVATRLDTMFRLMSGGRATPKDREMILKGLYPGLLKDEIELNNTGVTKVEIEYVNSQNTTASAARGADTDKE
jgi:hypothetical protein